MLIWARENIFEEKSEEEIFITTFETRMPTNSFRKMLLKIELLGTYSWVKVRFSAHEIIFAGRTLAAGNCLTANIWQAAMESPMASGADPFTLGALSSSAAAAKTTFTKKTIIISLITTSYPWCNFGLRLRFM
jgi:hypothetical protein